MKVLSVNTSLPKEVEYKGKIVKTGIFKTPVQGNVKVHTLNLEGDGQADLVGHGGEMRAVYVYSHDNYSHWEKELSRRDPFPFGQFGENLTVQEMLDHEVHIGDQFRIGSALFEVTQPRVPCFKLAMKMEVEGFYNKILKSGRLGFYFRVLEEGELFSGANITRTKIHPEKMTVQLMNSLMYFDKNNHDLIRQALEIPALSPGWRSTFEDRLAKQIDNNQERAVYQSFIVSKKVQETDNVTSFYLKPESNSSIEGYLPGQFLPLKLDIPGQYQTIYRTYTLSDSPSHKYYRLTIKREKAPSGVPNAYPGVSSNYFHDHVEVGTKLFAASPRGTFFLNKEKQSSVIMISAGVGVTPMISMLNTLIEDYSEREIVFVHSTRNGNEHIMKAYIESLAAKYNNLRTFITYSQPNPDDVLGKDYNASGRISGRILMSYLNDKEGDFYLCGPQEFMKSLIYALLEWGVTDSNIYYENFGPASQLIPNKSSRMRQGETKDNNNVNKVRFQSSKLEVPWNPSFDNLLDFAEAQGLNPDFSCRSGICQTCECKISEGEIEYIQEPLVHPAEGSVLLCCSIPKTSIVLDI